MALRWLVVFGLVVGLVGSGLAFSQSSLPTQGASDTVEAISSREWIRMKRQWSKQADKWSSCNRGADDQKLSGRNSRPFIAACMKL